MKENKPIKKTIKDRIISLAEKHEIKDPTFMTDVMDIVERGSFPENFCPECTERMIFDSFKSILRCINCGYTHSGIDQQVKTKPTGKIPDGLVKALEDTPDKAKSTTSRTPGKAEQILKLHKKAEHSCY